jgi:integrase
MAWQPVGENLVRWNGGTIYLRAKVAGKVCRVSLKTSDLRIAKLKREAKLAELRRLASVAGKGDVRTMAEAIDLLESSLLKPHLKRSSRTAYSKWCRKLREQIGGKALAAKWGGSEAAAWWTATTAELSPHPANTLLRLVRLMAGLLVDRGVWPADPTTGIKAMRPIKRELVLPSRQQLDAMLEEIRTRPHANAALRADMVAFLAFSGCRTGEMPAIRWEDLRGDWLTIDGGEEGTKNRKSRQIPISPALRAVLDRLHYEGATGPIFLMGKPRFALTTACKAAKIPHLRIHDLRHWFASWAIENGIEIPTIARWMGHQDGGALLMKTYGHLRDQHSLDQAKRLR